jgi:holin-like protein
MKRGISMKLYVQFMIILAFSFLGEFLSTLLNLPIPGSILGLILLFLALETKLIRLRHIDLVGNFLLANMTILFLPAAVGIMEKFEEIKDYLIPIMIIILGAIFINVLVIGFVVQFVKNHFEGDYEDKGVKHE